MIESDRAKYEDKVYQDAWDSGPYTSFAMIAFMIGKVPDPSEEAKIRTFLRDPGVLARIKPEEMKRDWNEGRLGYLVYGRSGLCTSFSIKVVDTLNKQGGYDFKFFDLGIHRLALCDKTKVVIDSSVRSAGKLRSSTGNRLEVSGRRPRTYKATNKVRESCSIQEVQEPQIHSNSVGSCVLKKSHGALVSDGLPSFQHVYESFELFH